MWVHKQKRVSTFSVNSNATWAAIQEKASLQKLHQTKRVSQFAPKSNATWAPIQEKESLGQLHESKRVSTFQPTNNAKGAHVSDKKSLHELKTNKVVSDKVGHWKKQMTYALSRNRTRAPPFTCGYPRTKYSTEIWKTMIENAQFITDLFLIDTN